MGKILISFAFFLSVFSTQADVIIYDEPTLAGSSLPNCFASAKHPIGGTYDTCSYNNPYSGSQCIEGTLVSPPAKFSILLGAGWIDPTEFTALVYHIRQKNQGGGTLNVHAYGGAQLNDQQGLKAVVGNHFYGMVGTNITTYQTITIPMSAFAFPAGTVVNRFTFDVVNPNSGFYIDDIILVGPGVIRYPDPYPTPTPTL